MQEVSSFGVSYSSAGEGSGDDADELAELLASGDE
jgi:hypothetical protein